MTTFKIWFLLLAVPALLLKGIQGESFIRGESDVDVDSGIERELQTNGYNEALGWCRGATCGMWGDPHMITCDGVGYDCQGVGMFTLMKNHMYNIQARFVSVGSHELGLVEGWGLTEGASLTNDVAIDFLQNDAAPVMQLGFGNLNNRPDGKFPSEDGCTPYQYYHPIDGIPGQGRSVEPNVMSCRQRCEDTEGCTKFHFWADGGCHLNNDDQIPKAAPTNWVRSLSGPLTSNCGLPPPEMEIKEKEQRLKHGRIGANCPLLFHMDGEMVDISDIHWDGYLYGDENSDVYVQLVNNHYVRVVYKLPTNDYAEVILISKGDGPAELWSCHWDFYVCLPQSQQTEFETSTIGLLGTPDGNTGNDFMKSNGEQIIMQDTFNNWHKTLIEYCYTNWCVSQEESIMAYPGELTYEDMKCEKEEYKDFDIHNDDCVLSATLIKEACEDKPPLMVHGCQIDCCLGGCDQVQETVDELINIKTLSEEEDVILYDFPKDDPDPCTSDGFEKTANVVCPSSDIPIVKLIKSTGAADLPEGADVFYDIQLDEGDDRVERIVKFRINNPFDASADVFIKHDKRVFETAFMDPHCDDMLETKSGCDISAPVIEVACHDYEGSNPFAIVRVYFASSDLPVLDTSSVDKCCYPPDYESSVGVVGYTFEIQCHCQDSTAVE